MKTHSPVRASRALTESSTVSSSPHRHAHDMIETFSERATGARWELEYLES